MSERDPYNMLADIAYRCFEIAWHQFATENPLAWPAFQARQIDPHWYLQGADQ